MQALYGNVTIIIGILNNYFRLGKFNLPSTSTESERLQSSPLKCESKIKSSFTTSARFRWNCAFIEATHKFLTNKSQKNALKL